MISLLLDNLPCLTYRQTFWRTMRRYWYRALSPRLTLRTSGNGCGMSWISARHTTCRIPGRSGCDSASPSARRKTSPRPSKRRLLRPSLSLVHYGGRRGKVRGLAAPAACLPAGRPAASERTTAAYRAPAGPRRQECRLTQGKGRAWRSRAGGKQSRSDLPMRSRRGSTHRNPCRPRRSGLRNSGIAAATRPQTQCRLPL